MIDLGLLSSALGSAQALSDITKSMIGLKNAAEVNAKAIEMQAVIFSLHGEIATAIAAQAQLSEENSRLKDQLSNLENFAREAERYRLFKPWPGALVYALKQSMSQGEPAHYLCTNCFQAKKKAILYGAPGSNSSWPYCHCPQCRIAFPIDTMDPGLTADYAPDLP